MSEKVHPDPGKMTKKQLRREVRAARQEEEDVEGKVQKRKEKEKTYKEKEKTYKEKEKKIIITI
jgi:hypothetical protein